MTVTEFAAIVVAIAVVAAAVFLITAVNNLNNTLAKLEDTAHQLRDEGIAAFRDLRQLVADADAELDKGRHRPRPGRPCNHRDQRDDKTDPRGGPGSDDPNPCRRLRHRQGRQNLVVRPSEAPEEIKGRTTEGRGMKRLLKWRRLRWFVIGGAVRFVLRRTASRSVDQATADIEAKLPRPVKRALGVMPADAARAGGSAVVAARSAKRVAAGTQRVTRLTLRSGPPGHRCGLPSPITADRHRPRGGIPQA